MKNLAPRPVRQLHSGVALFGGALWLVSVAGCNDILGIASGAQILGSSSGGDGAGGTTGGAGGENATNGNATGQSGSGTAGTGTAGAAGNGGTSGAAGSTGSPTGTGEPGGSGGDEGNGGSGGPTPNGGNGGSGGSRDRGGNGGDGGSESPAGAGAGGMPNAGTGPGGASGSNAGAGGTTAGAGGFGGAGGSFGLCDNPAQLGGEMVLIAGGTADIGDDDFDDSALDANATPIHEVTFDDFCIDRTEVTVSAYAECVTANGCIVPTNIESGCNWGVAGRNDHPIQCVTPAQAIAYCSWAQKRLPTEKEWEYAARGTARRKFPWGPEAPDTNRASWNNTSDSTSAVGVHTQGATPGTGLQDLAGNVWEYTASLWTVGYGGTPVAGDYVARGGSYGSVAADFLRTGYRDGTQDPGARFGFRCAFGPGQGL